MLSYSSFETLAGNQLIPLFEQLNPHPKYLPKYLVLGPHTPGHYSPSPRLDTKWGTSPVPQSPLKSFKLGSPSPFTLICYFPLETKVKVPACSPSLPLPCDKPQRSPVYQVPPPSVTHMLNLRTMSRMNFLMVVSPYKLTLSYT